MRRASWSVRTRHPARRWLAPALALVALAWAAPVVTSAPTTGTTDGGQGTELARTRLAPGVDAATPAGSTGRSERRDLPAGWAPSAIALALLAAVGVALARPIGRSVPFPVPAFRRRAPPVLRVAS